MPTEFKTFLKNNWQTALFLLLMAAAAFLRLYLIKDYVVFLGDEGRDMIVMRDIFVKHHLPFLGPTASVGGFYLGPIYYWMAAPFLLLARFDPIGPAYMVAALGILTVVILYKFLARTVGFWPAILASGLYATAPLVVRYSRSSWNPNPLPFFAFLSVYFSFLGLKNDKKLYFLLTGACLGIAIQLHYLALVMFFVIGSIILTSWSVKKIILSSLAVGAGALITFSPFLLFEATHGFPNFKTILEFVTRGSTVGYQSFHLLWITNDLGNILLENLTNLKGTALTKLFFWFLVLGGAGAIYLKWKTKQKLIYIVGYLYFVVGLLGLRLYKGEIFDYYFEFLYPAPFLLTGLIVALIWQKVISRPVILVLTVVSIVYFLTHNIFVSPPNHQIRQTEIVADLVIEKAQGKPYNFGLISDHNSDDAYRYFLEIKKQGPTLLDTVITDQLLVVCESKICQPLGHPQWEIAAFGRGEIDGTWELKNLGITVFRLIHWSGEPSPAGKPAKKG